MAADIDDSYLWLHIAFYNELFLNLSRWFFQVLNNFKCLVFARKTPTEHRLFFGSFFKY